MNKTTIFIYFEIDATGKLILKYSPGQNLFLPVDKDGRWEVVWQAIQPAGNVPMPQLNKNKILISGYTNDTQKFQIDMGQSNASQLVATVDSREDLQAKITFAFTVGTGDGGAIMGSGTIRNK